MSKLAVMPNPIMSPEDERFMAFQGLLQWTQAVVDQTDRVLIAQARHMTSITNPQNFGTQLFQFSRAFQTECHFFAIAAYKVLEYRDWVLSFSLCASVDFSEINSFSKDSIRDLRNMREHIVEYFKGDGHCMSRWVEETPEYKVDASSVIGTKIGGRLDWVAFGKAAERLLIRLIAEPCLMDNKPICAHVGCSESPENGAAEKD